MIVPKPKPEDSIVARAREVITDCKLVVEHAKHGRRGFLQSELKDLIEIGRQAGKLVHGDVERT
jgi:hypothetical protein